MVIMEHPPRVDDKFKSQLAKLANTTLSQLWVISPLKDKISIGCHSLESPGVGSSHLARYKDFTTGRYGPTGVRDYTDSVNSILLMSLHEELTTQPSARTGFGFVNNEEDHNICEQAQYQWNHTKVRRSHKQTNRTAKHKVKKQSNKGAQFQSVPTQNRFNFFNQGN